VYGSATNTATGSVYYMFTSGFPSPLGTATFHDNYIYGNKRIQSVCWRRLDLLFFTYMQSITTNMYKNVADSNYSATNGTAYGFYSTTNSGKPN